MLNQNTMNISPFYCDHSDPLPVRFHRKLVVKVVEARNLPSKDIHEDSSGTYVVVDFDGQEERTSTKFRALKHVWNERLDFAVEDPKNMDKDKLYVEVYKNIGRDNLLLGGVSINGSQFSRRGEERLVYYPFEKKSVFSWVHGEIGLKIYYYDELAGEKLPNIHGQLQQELPLPQPHMQNSFDF